MVIGLSSGSVAPTQDLGFDVPSSVVAIKNPTSKITYDEHNHERYPPGDPNKCAFAYASLIRLFVLKFVLSMSTSKDVLALASLGVDLSSIEPGTTVTVKWRGKSVFIRRRTEDDINLANSVDMNSLRDPQEDAVSVKNPEWLVVVGVCTHLGCILCRMQVTLVVGFALATGHTTTYQAKSERDQPLTTWRSLLTTSCLRISY